MSVQIEVKAVSASALRLAEVKRRRGVERLTGQGAPLAPADGVRLLLEADAEGDAEAPLVLATLRGMGAGAPQSWTAAVELVARGAARGSERAARLLNLLAAGPGGEPSASQDFAGLAGAVDISLWTQAPPRIPVRDAPRIRRIPEFVSSAVCRHLIGIGHGRVRPAAVYDAQTGASRLEAARSNAALELSLDALDLLVVLLRARISSAVGVPPVAMEPPQILHYAVGEKFDRHFDFLDDREPGLRRDIALRGQRIVTALIYLNDDYEGGETAFPLIDLEIRGRAGEAVFWANIDRSGAPDRLTLHAGAPPTRGEKWVLSQWIRDRAPPAV